MTLIKLLLRRLFSIDPEYKSVVDRTDRLHATINGDTQWMKRLTCRPENEEFIGCDDGNKYKKVK